MPRRQGLRAAGGQRPSFTVRRRNGSTGLALPTRRIALGSMARHLLYLRWYRPRQPLKRGVRARLVKATIREGSLRLCPARIGASQGCVGAGHSSPPGSSLFDPYFLVWPRRGILVISDHSLSVQLKSKPHFEQESNVFCLQTSAIADSIQKGLCPRDSLQGLDGTLRKFCLTGCQLVRPHSV